MGRYKLSSGFLIPDLKYSFISQVSNILKIGLTGGIGSGKTTIARIFEILGIPVYYADNAAKRIMNENARVRKHIAEHFGEDIYQHGMLDRSALATRVFDNPDLLSLLNSIVHPATIDDANEWIGEQTSPYIIKEAALIFETDSHQYLDYVIGISAPVALRINRTMQRDRSSEAAVQLRIKRQLDESEKLERCDFLILNDESKLVIPQVLALHEKLLALAQKKVPDEYRTL